jgi:hypothetical protein
LAAPFSHLDFPPASKLTANLNLIPAKLQCKVGIIEGIIALSPFTEHSTATLTRKECMPAQGHIINLQELGMHNIHAVASDLAMCIKWHADKVTMRRFRRRASGET